MLSDWDITVGKNLAACHACPHRQPTCRGPCACTKTHLDITAMSEDAKCPIGLHRKPPARGLGDAIAGIAKTIGAEKAASAFQQITGKDCGCAKRRQALNRLIPFQ